MQVDNCYKTFARTVYLNLSQLHYEQVREGQLVAKAILNGKYSSKLIPKEVSLVIREGKAVIQTRSLLESDVTPNYEVAILEALPKDEAIDAMIDEAKESANKSTEEEEMIDCIYYAIQLIMGLPDEDTITLL